MDTNRHTEVHISRKFQNNGDKEKPNKEKMAIYKELRIRMPSEFSKTTMKAKRLHR